MPARQGSSNPWSGPRLPRRIEPLLPDHEELADAAKGEPVRRCWNCGRPALGRSVIDYTLVLHGQIAGKWRLCDDCHGDRNPSPYPPGSSDPLDVTAA